MASTNTTGLELAFNELIDELSKVRDLVNLAETYRDKADIISTSLERFLELANKKYEKLELIVFQENTDIVKIKDDINGLQSLINSQVNSVNNEIENSVSCLKELLSAYNERISGIGQIITQNHNDNLAKSEELSELFTQYQTVSIETIVTTVDSAKDHMSNIKDILSTTLEDCRKTIVESTNAVFSKLDVNSINLSESINTNLSRSKEDIILSVGNVSTQLNKDMTSLSELVKFQEQSIKRNNEGISSAVELIKDSIKSVSDSRDALINEIALLSNKLVALLNKQSGDIDSTKELITQRSDSVLQAFSALNSQIKEYLTKEFTNLYTSQIKLDHNIRNLENELLVSLTQLSKKIDKNNKTNKILLTIIIVLLSISVLCSICL